MRADVNDLRSKFRTLRSAGAPSSSSARLRT